MQSPPVKVWLTGATGLLGSAILRNLSENMQAFALARDVSPLANSSKFVPLSVDIADFGSLQRLLQAHSPQLIIHAAAMTNVDQCENDPYLAARINVEGARNIARIAAESDSQLIYVSTDSVFDGQKGNYAETDVANPLNVYAKTKYQGECAVLTAHPNSLVVRTNFFGQGGIGKIDLATWFIRQLSTGEPVNGFEDVYFSPVVSDILAGLLFELAASNLTGILHLSGAEKLSKYAFGIHVARWLKIPESRIRPTRVSQAKFRALRSLDTSLNCEKAERFLGRKLPDIETSLATFFRLMADNPPREFD